MFKTISTLSQETRTPIDTDGDGTIDRIEFDLDGDGIIDRTVHLDAEGRWEREERDVDDDGTIDRITHYAYDDDGNRTRAEIDFGADGNINQTRFDDDADGNFDRIEAYTYNSDGNRTRTRFDDDADGNFDRSEIDFDADGNINQTRFDGDDDGTNDRIEAYIYDDDGNRTRTRFDDDADGNFDRSEIDFNADGNINQTRFDGDDDGTNDRIEAYIYDDDGNRTRTRFDDDADGNFDRSEIDFNADGNINQTRFDGDDDGTNDRIEAYTYNSDGNRTRTRFDDDADGNFDRSEFDFNVDGNIDQTRFDDDDDGTNDRTEFYTYGANGRVSQTGFDDDGDGTIDRIERALSSLDGTNGFILTGIDADDQSGASVSSAGDVNGDGYDDLIIGARYADPNGDSEAGETYIVYGGASAPGEDGVFDLSDLDGTNGFILDGIDASDYSGFSVSSAGDVNGDGYDDLIIGAYQADPNGDRSGETYIVFGGASAPGTGGRFNLSTLDGSNGFILTGIDRDDNSGVSVSSAGDVNGDGYDDLIIGAWRADPNDDDRAGETYVVYGGASAPGTGGVLDLSMLNGSNGFILNGIDGNDRSGRFVSSAGDVNGDGYDDLIIGAWRADPNGNDDAGETYVIYGGASAPGTGGVLDLSGLDGTNGFILNGIDASDFSGFSVSSAGDVNGDGYDDLIIGARLADPNGDSGAGETYIVYGGASAPGTGGVLDLSDLDGSNGFILTGIDRDDNSGVSVSSAGDVNGDGYDDLIIGAREADPNGDNSGESYVIYGGATGTESLTPVTASGTATADNFTGNAGADSFTAIATGDVVRGGAGDDTISVTALDFAAIDGGTGQDTLILDGAGLALDLTGPGHAGVDSVEMFDLSGTGANSLVLDALAVFAVTEERAGGAASLDVLGDADDRVDLSGSSFALTGTATEDGVTYNVYRDGNAQLRIEDGVMVTLAATGAQSAESKTDIRIDPVADPRTDPGTGTIRLDNPLMNNDLWNNDLWDDLWADGVKSPDQPVHMDEDAILIPLSDPLSFGPLASGPLPGPWGDLLYWPGLENHPAMQNDLAMILPEMEIVTAYMEGF